MQPGYSQPPELDSAKIAFKQGIIFGPILAVISISFNLISTLSALGSLNTATTSSSAFYDVFFSFLLNLLVFLLGVGAYLFVGARGSNQTARVSTGTLAGLWTGLIYGFIELVGRLIIFFVISYPTTVEEYQSQAASTQNNLNIVLFAAVVGVVFDYLFAIGIGAGFGALGGLIGRARARKRLLQSPPLYNEQMYQGSATSSASVYTPYGQPPRAPYGQPPSAPYGQPQSPSYTPSVSPIGYDSPGYYQQPAFSPQQEPAEPPVAASSEWGDYEPSGYEPQYVEAASIPAQEQSIQVPETPAEKTQLVSPLPDGEEKTQLVSSLPDGEEKTQLVSPSSDDEEKTQLVSPPPDTEEKTQLVFPPSDNPQESQSREQEGQEQKKEAE